jgi:AcrR family transcriptional regulator
MAQSDPRRAPHRKEQESSRSAGWQVRHQRVSGNIEAVAQRLFAERGYAQVTIEDVAAQVGCSVRTVTRYFPTKDALLLTQRRRMNQVVLDAFEAVAPGENAAAAIWQVWMDLALRAAVLGELTAYLDWKHAASTAPEVVDRAEGEQRRTLQEVLSAIVAASLGADPEHDMRPRLVAATLESAHSALIDFWVRRGGVDDLQNLYRTAAEFLGIELPAPSAPFGAH